MSEQHQHGPSVEVQTLYQVVSIVSAYVSHNSLRPADLPELIASIHTSVRGLTTPTATSEAKVADNPAVPVKKSIHKDFIICLEDGKKFKSLRRHLSSFHGLTPDAYRTKWGLPADYPMVAPSYSATRSQLAKDSGLGQVSHAPVVADVEAESMRDAEPKTAKRGRPKKKVAS